MHTVRAAYKRAHYFGLNTPRTSGRHSILSSKTKRDLISRLFCTKVTEKMPSLYWKLNDRSRFREIVSEPGVSYLVNPGHMLSPRFLKTHCEAMEKMPVMERCRKAYSAYCKARNINRYGLAERSPYEALSHSSFARILVPVETRFTWYCNLSPLNKIDSMQHCFDESFDELFTPLKTKLWDKGSLQDHNHYYADPYSSIRTLHECQLVIGTHVSERSYVPNLIILDDLQVLAHCMKWEEREQVERIVKALMTFIYNLPNYQVILTYYGCLSNLIEYDSNLNRLGIIDTESRNKSS